jgi:hypothetical protein
MDTLAEDAENADWLKRPSDLIASLDDPEVQTPEQLMRSMKKQGMAHYPLYKRMVEDEAFRHL